MNELKWVDNAYDYRRDNAPDMYCYIPEVNKNEQWQQHLQWAKQFIIGDPKESKYYTVHAMKHVHMIGLYQEEIKKDV